MNDSTSRRAGLLLLGLLSFGDMSTIFLTDGETPPYPVAVVDLVLGTVCLVLVIQALREPSSPLRLLIGLRVLSAASVLPAFLVDEVPAAAEIAATVIVVLTAVGVVLTSRVRTRTPVATS